MCEKSGEVSVPAQLTIFLLFSKRLCYESSRPGINASFLLVGQLNVFFHLFVVVLLLWCDTFVRKQGTAKIAVWVLQSLYHLSNGI
jgi:hypothetical protein